MYLIEGIGDEVVQFFIFVFIICLVIAAWQSTKVREANLCFTLLTQWLYVIMYEEMLRRRLLRPNRNNRRSAANIRVSMEIVPGSVGLGDAREEEISTASSASTTSGQGSEHSSADDQSRENPEGGHTSRSSPNDGNMVNIKLKFPNSSVKIANGDLNEKLGKFKRRHFNTDLTQGKSVVFIFRGKVLKNENHTLGACGLFGNCVVHVLIREPLPDASRSERSRNRTDENLSMIFIASVGVLLVGVWYSRYRYAEAFTLSATTALMVMTGLYIAFLVGSYLPEGRQVNLLPIRR